MEIIGYSEERIGLLLYIQKKKYHRDITWFCNYGQEDIESFKNIYEYLEWYGHIEDIEELDEELGIGDMLFLPFKTEDDEFWTEDIDVVREKLGEIGIMSHINDIVCQYMTEDGEPFIRHIEDVIHYLKDNTFDLSNKKLHDYVLDWLLELNCLDY